MYVAAEQIKCISFCAIATVFYGLISSSDKAALHIFMSVGQSVSLNVSILTPEYNKVVSDTL